MTLQGHGQQLQQHQPQERIVAGPLSNLYCLDDDLQGQQLDQFSRDNLQRDQKISLLARQLVRF